MGERRGRRALAVAVPVLLSVFEIASAREPAVRRPAPVAVRPRTNARSETMYSTKAEAEAALSLDPMCGLCACRVESWMDRPPLRVNVIVDRSSSAIAVDAANRLKAYDALDALIDHQVDVLRGDAGATIQKPTSHGNFSPISRTVSSLAPTGEAYVIVTDGLDHEENDPLQCEGRATRLLDEVDKSVAKGTQLFFVIIDRRNDDCDQNTAPWSSVPEFPCPRTVTPPGTCRSVRVSAPPAAEAQAIVGPAVASTFASWVKDVLELHWVVRDLPGEAAELAQLVGDDDRWKCTGVLVAPDALLTAKHCMPITRVMLEGDRSSKGRVVRAVESAASGTSDLVLVRLAEQTIEPVALRRGGRDDEPPSGVLRFVGFGTTDSSGTAGFGSRKILDMAASGWACNDERARRLGCSPATEMVVPASLGRDTCTGDSGGPLLELWGDKRTCGWRLVANASRGVGSGGAACGSAGVYSRADRAAGWIDEVLARWRGAEKADAGGH